VLAHAHGEDAQVVDAVGVVGVVVREPDGIDASTPAATSCWRSSGGVSMRTRRAVVALDEGGVAGAAVARVGGRADGRSRSR
jgi:hypothetical protein